MRICQNCGTEVSDTAKFCRICGTRLQDGEVAAEPAEKTAPFEGTDYSWGPPTGSPEDYDQPAMPPVYMGAEQKQEDAEEESAYTYTVETPEWDHTEEFDEKDISDNKVIAMAAYLLGPIGIIIALLAGQSSPYAAFHMRQALKIVVLGALAAVIAMILCWTLIVPAAGIIFEIILAVVTIISFVSVCKGRAIEPPFVRSFGFLK